MNDLKSGINKAAEGSEQLANGADQLVTEVKR